MQAKAFLENIVLPEDTKKLLADCEYIYIPESEKALYDKCCQHMEGGSADIKYFVQGRGVIQEATLTRCKNGLAVNYAEDSMRRRDPDSMSIADTLPSDKPRFSRRYGYSFDTLRKETFAWLSSQRLVLMPFKAGGRKYGSNALLICPENAAFFALALSMMQGFVPPDVFNGPYEPCAVIYLAPPFRHSHFKGKQAVVHQRSEKLHEIFAYNLYPGPSAKKGVFSILLDRGEREGRIINHASAVMTGSEAVKSLVFMHEGASGGGKSEMLERPRRDGKGRFLLGENILSGEKLSMPLKESCTLRPIADDMVLAGTDERGGTGRLIIADGEEGWFLRLDGDSAYGSIPEYERISIHPEKPLMFFNIEAAGGATCLIWEHIKNSDGSSCTNPRMIIPRTALGCDGENPYLPVDVRSFGLRMPPSTKKAPNYGIMAMVQIVPTALAWLWRLISPRGYNNPSISGPASGGLISEGVGSYWPFATGCKVKQANLLLKQLTSCPNTLNILIPNQHIGAYSVGFAPQWTLREFLSRRGGKIKAEELISSRCPLLGWELKELSMDGWTVPPELLHPCIQPELGTDGYDAGAKLITDFFKKELEQYLTPELEVAGREIIELCMDDAPLEAYMKLSPPMDI